jgi:hypothetical protein
MRKERTVRFSGFFSLDGVAVNRGVLGDKAGEQRPEAMNFAE